MSKLLVQSKTFLPMVIQKSTTEATRVLENHPSLSAQQSVTEEVTKHEVDDKINICIQRNTDNTSTPETPPLTILRACIMDLAQMQERLLLLWARGHLWMSGQRGGLLRTLPVIMGNPSQVLWVEGRPRTVDRDVTHAASAASAASAAVRPTTTVPTIAPEAGKRRPANSDPYASSTSELPTTSRRSLQNKREPSKGATAESPFRSNLWEVVQQRSPAWQATIATKLGALQKIVVQKLSK